jgi:hypothetical protein
LCSVLLTKFYSGDQVKNEMRRACSTYGGEEGCIQGFGGGTSGKNHLEDPGVDARIILKWVCKKWDGGMYWIDVAQNRDSCQTLVNAVMNLRVPKNSGIS